MYIYIYTQYPSLFPIAQKQKGSTPESNTIELFDDAWGFTFHRCKSHQEAFFPMEKQTVCWEMIFSGQPHNRCEKKKKHMGVSKNSGFPPKSSMLMRVFHYKPSILGYPYFWKHLYGTNQKNPVSWQTFDWKEKKWKKMRKWRFQNQAPQFHSPGFK